MDPKNRTIHISDISKAKLESAPPAPEKVCKAKCSTGDWEPHGVTGLRLERAKGWGADWGHAGSRAETRLLHGVFAGGHDVSYVSLSGPLWSSPADGNDENGKAVRKLVAEIQTYVSVVVKYKPCFWLKGLQSPSELLPMTPPNSTLFSSEKSPGNAVL